jgi:hypothetical protein
MPTVRRRKHVKKKIAKKRIKRRKRTPKVYETSTGRKYIRHRGKRIYIPKDKDDTKKELMAIIKLLIKQYDTKHLKRKKVRKRKPRGQQGKPPQPESSAYSIAVAKEAQASQFAAQQDQVKQINEAKRELENQSKQLAIEYKKAKNEPDKQLLKNEMEEIKLLDYEYEELQDLQNVGADLTLKYETNKQKYTPEQIKEGERQLKANQDTIDKQKKEIEKRKKDIEIMERQRISEAKMKADKDHYDSIKDIRNIVRKEVTEGKKKGIIDQSVKVPNTKKDIYDKFKDEKWFKKHPQLGKPDYSKIESTVVVETPKKEQPTPGKAKTEKIPPKPTKKPKPSATPGEDDPKPSTSNIFIPKQSEPKDKPKSGTMKAEFSDITEYSDDDTIAFFDFDSDDDDDFVMPKKKLFGKGRRLGKGLSDQEINMLMGKYPLFEGTHAANEMKDVKVSKKFGCVFNTKPRKIRHGHWCGLYVDSGDDKSIEWFDPFGEDPPSMISKGIKHIVKKLNPDEYLKYKVNRIQVQDPRTDTCGYHSMKFLINRFKGKPFAEVTGYNVKSEEPKAQKMQDKFENFGYI